MNISASQVKELRERTGVGMMECKKALVETNGDIESAVELMRKKGQAKADKKSGRVAAEGVIRVNSNAQIGIVLEVNSETDFAAKDQNFLDYVARVSDIALQEKVTDIAALQQCAFSDNGESVEQARQNLVAKIGENVQLRRLTRVKVADHLGTYLHGSRIGVLVNLKGGDATLAKDLAMHIAAGKPLVVNPEDVPQADIDKETEIFSAQAKESGKPENIIEKMVAGRIKKFLAEVSLVGQAFVKDPNTTVGQLIKAANAEVLSFVRMEVGEGIEKKVDNFAEEVMAQVREA